MSANTNFAYLLSRLVVSELSFLNENQTKRSAKQTEGEDCLSGKATSSASLVRLSLEMCEREQASVFGYFLGKKYLKKNVIPKLTYTFLIIKTGAILTKPSFVHSSKLSKVA